ncbi:hypothetical protein ARMSODRAFT_1022781 [Armillaria solidipes]|uniref:CxC2-like cysteine cluster KDZ transposase-associated domain-containing protein n=1 Tax=Armillaria solidipes TaxID=1076256 RepID=A0A2H3B519_9AGAR|nr:hypothetical protein ARMSODRAFT_1022781 [Armillaria solidipes]
MAGKRRRRRYLSSDAPFLKWSGTPDGVGYRKQYLDAFICLEGQEASADVVWCETCIYADAERPGVAGFCCVDCLGDHMECKQCILHCHQCMPLHRIEEWKGEYFERVTLQSLGLHIQLGHAGRECDAIHEGPSDFTVLHTNGIHQIAIDFCNCSQRLQHHEQLLRFRWFPATVHQPQTCATFAVLNNFQTMNHAGKLSAWEHFVTLINLMDNLGILMRKPLYTAYLRMIREYRHIQMMKRFGRGHFDEGIKSTGQGELVLPCLGCPQPGINMEIEWVDEKEEDGYLNHPVLSADANFRMNEYFRGTDTSDPGLHTGLAYYVEQKGYRAHLRKHVMQKDISTCSGFQTLAHAETKISTGMRSTGVVMCLCARHEMIRPLGVGDLQKGERYCNVDYAVLLGIRGLRNLPALFFSYDIACQWCIKLNERMEELPNLAIPPLCRLDFGVPKCHCPGHKRQCQCQFSMNVKPGVAQTDGEGIERTWSEVNKVAGSTKVMGPGHHHDMLDDIFGNHNYRKLMGLGESLQRKASKAAREYALQSRAHTELMLALPDGRCISIWTAEVEGWERDNTAPNPYLESIEHVSEAQVQLDLIKEEDEEVASGTPELDETSVTSSAVGCHQGFGVHARVGPQCGEQVQVDWDRQEKTLAENLPLWLPSELEARVRAQGCLAGIAKKEERLWEAQCADALDKVKNTPREQRQQYNISEINARDWEQKYQELKQADLTYVGSIFTIEEAKKKQMNKKRKKKRKAKQAHIIFMQPGDGKKVTSWIWRMEGALGDGTDDDLTQAAHLEWLKSRARMHRWHEEVAMVEREKERVQLGLEHMAKQWEDCIGRHVGLNSALTEGMTAYAKRQATCVYRHLREHFRDIWLGSVEVADEEIHEEDPLSAQSVYPSYIVKNVDSSGPSEMEGDSSDLHSASESESGSDDSSSGESGASTGSDAAEA